MKWGIGLAALTAALAGRLEAQQAAAPAGRCELQFAARNPAAPPHVSQFKQPSGRFNSFIGGGVIARCPAQEMTLVADSAEYFGDRRLLHLIGQVHYTEPRLTLDSDVANYYMAEERLEALGKVHAVLPSGTTLDGSRVEYYRAAPGIRTIATMVAPERPTIRVVERDSTGKPMEPMTVIANTVTMRGDSLVYASGRVEITRPDVVATGDSAALDSGREFARLLRQPRITARGDRPFVLTGRIIDLHGRNRALERVVAQGAAKAVSQDATLTADTLDFRLAGGRLQRVYAWGGAPARATNPTYLIVSDSMDVRMPEQRMREIRALGQAFAQSVPDTTKVHTTERDWLKGDSIYAAFDSSALALADTAGQPQLRQLVAVGHASSFYQLAPKDTAAIGPAINYVRGDRITVAFADRQVQQVTIAGEAAGVYVDPTPPSDTSRRPSTPGREGVRRNPPRRPMR